MKVSRAISFPELSPYCLHLLTLFFRIIMKPISPTLHGVLDYFTCGFFLLAPSLFDLTGTPAYVCYVLAGGYLVISLLTSMPLGVLKVIPFWLHGRLEMVSGLVFLASPWIFNFSQNGTLRNLFMGAGVVFLIVFMLTQWRPQGQTAAELQHG
jgi:hypothetical protein